MVNDVQTINPTSGVFRVPYPAPLPARQPSACRWTSGSGQARTPVASHTCSSNTRTMGADSFPTFPDPPLSGPPLPRNKAQANVAGVRRGTVPLLPFLPGPRGGAQGLGTDRTRGGPEQSRCSLSPHRPSAGSEFFSLLRREETEVPSQQGRQLARWEWGSAPKSPGSRSAPGHRTLDWPEPRALISASETRGRYYEDPVLSKENGLRKGVSLAQL